MAPSTSTALFFLPPPLPTFPTTTTIAKTTRIQRQSEARKLQPRSNRGLKTLNPITSQPATADRQSPFHSAQAGAMIIKNLKARILRVLKSGDAAAGSPPPSPTKPAAQHGGVVDGCLSDDACFFDAREPEETPPTKADRRPSAPPEPLDAWELVDDLQDGSRAASPAPDPSPDPDPLLGFPARCPPGGESAVVLYTTTLRGVRRTFEDCNGVRALLENLGAAFQERDVSMDRGLRDQLWSVTGEKGAVPPRLFVRGRDVGGAAQVLALHEEGRLVPALASCAAAAGGGGAGGEAKKEKRGGRCEACGGLRFVVCGVCDGSRKVFDGGRCQRCNENGLVMCPLCL